MNRMASKRDYFFLVLLPFLPLFGKAQIGPYTPGPANMDTSKFAHIYFLRDHRDDFPDNWLGVILQDDEGLCVKAKMDRIYRVNTVLTGETRLWTQIKNVREEIRLNLYPSHSYYVELRPVRQEDQSIAGRMKIIDPSEGAARISKHPRRIQERYCVLPYLQGNHDFLENTWEDSIRWYAAKDWEYSFLPLPSWEVILRSSLRTVFSFRNKHLSETYSEAGGILYLNLKKCKSESEFEAYCREKFIRASMDSGTDSIAKTEIKPVQVPDGIRHARIVHVELHKHSKLSNKDKPLTIRSCYVVFHWLDQRGKGKTASLYTSERGLPEELHSPSELEKRILGAWQSFKLVKK